MVCRVGAPTTPSKTCTHVGFISVSNQSKQLWDKKKNLLQISDVFPNRQSSASVKAQRTWQHGLRLFRALPYGSLAKPGLEMMDVGCPMPVLNNAQC